MKLESVRRLAAALCVIGLSVAVLGPIGGCASDGAAEEQRAGAAETRAEPRYQPREPQAEPFYNADLLFGMTRAVRGSTIHPGAQLPLLVLTVPLDIVFLPFAAIGGFF